MTSVSSDTVLEVEHLSVSFPTSRGTSTVVDDSSFTVEAGRTVGIVGESGSGKSMTSLAIMGLLPGGGRAVGSAKLKGKELLGLSDRAMRPIRGDRMAMVFQDPLSSLNPFYTVGLQIAEAYRSHRKVSKQAAKKIVIAALDRVGIPDPERRYNHYPDQFSGGMRQRIMIAMAICLEPELLICDEPTTALDVTVQAQILGLLSGLQKENGMGMVFITHDLAVVSEVADEVLVMRHGVTRERGTTEEIFTQPKDSYTRALLDALPRITDDPDAVMKETGEEHRS
ncbi:MAG: ABC transporter ATP-binding protein [Galactobacter sp.]|uniref:ABC transporter ATP-binding protein n=1 Tax=Galactobacter sp. TaxID=2676125 RepID=UPI0025BEC940|nr:ABC transporter ATP-binding protein [Galactobacter sp.]